MDKRHALWGALAGALLLTAGGFWWFTREAPAPEDAPMAAARSGATASTPSRPAPSPSPAPPAAASAKPAPESDAVALQEEELDKIRAETQDLAARAADLEEQVKDGDMILERQAQLIQKLEAELRKAAAETPRESKKK